MRVRRTLDHHAIDEASTACARRAMINGPCFVLVVDLLVVMALFRVWTKENEQRHGSCSCSQTRPSTISPTLNAMKLIAALTRQVGIAGAVDLHDGILSADGLRAR